MFFIDPKGDDALKLLTELPTLEGVTFLDPVRTGFSVNLFELPPHRPEDKERVRSMYTGYVLEIIRE